MTTSAIEFVTSSPEETFEIARRLGGRIGQEAMTLGLRGALGAGKTLFARGLASGLGVTDPGAVRSPTYVLMMEHPIGTGGRKLIHLDAYRMAGDLELIDLGIDDELGGRNVVVVEWYDRVCGALPTDLIEVEIAIEAEMKRRIRLVAGEGDLFLGFDEPGASAPVESH